MQIVIYIFLGMGLILLSGTLHYLSVWRRPGIYPPKKLLAQRTGALGAAAFILLAASALLFWIAN